MHPATSYVMLGFVAVVLAFETWYWLVYIPRVWRDGTNREVNDIKRFLKYFSENNDAS